MRITELYNPTEDMLTEGFIENTLKPQLEAIFSRKVKEVPKARQQYEAAMNRYVQELNALGVDGADIRKIAERKARALNPENLKSKFSKQLSEMFDEIKQGGLVSFTVPVITFITIIFVGTVFTGIFAASFGPELGVMIAVILMGPVTEEIGRWVNVKRRAGGQFTILFNIGEYTLFVMSSAAMGMSISAMALLRVFPVILHTLLTVLMRSGMQAGTPLVKTKATLLHSFYNMAQLIGSSFHAFAGVGVIAIPLAMASAKESPSIRDTTRMVVYGYSSEQDHQNIRIEIMAEEPKLIMVQDGIDPSFITSYASKINATVVSYDSFNEVKQEFKNSKERKTAVIMDDELLKSTVIMGGGAIKRWLRSSIYIKIVRSIKTEMEA